MKQYKFSILAAFVTGILLTSCVDDLNTVPLNKRTATADLAFKDPASFKNFLAKLYSTLTVTGQRGQAGLPDIAASDEGTTSFMRPYWCMQEETTDECFNAWGDASLTELHAQKWSTQNLYIQLLYQRIFLNIAYCNEFIRTLSPRISGFPTAMQDDATRYLAEARFLRAWFYYVALDMYGNVPFVTETDAVAAFLPQQIKRPDLFAYVESELVAILPTLAPPGTNEYARADQAAAWTLLAKLYLNAEVYTGTSRYADCITYCNKIIGTGVYSLNNNYRNLFLADNDKIANEIIFRIAEDGNNGQNYGGVTFIIHAAVGSSVNGEDPAADFGIGAGGWSGNRITDTFVGKFPDESGDTDKRAIFVTSKQTSLKIIATNDFTQGYLGAKFKNITSTGALGQNNLFVDTDFPLFRLADVYLMYAESVKRGGSGGDLNTALSYVNQIRQRAYGDTSGNISSSELTLPFILDERGRELYWEAQRRTDLIRFGMFTGNEYLWSWKGGALNGAGTDAKYNIFPIPASDIAVNTNLVQNTDY